MGSFLRSQHKDAAHYVHSYDLSVNVKNLLGVFH